MGKWEQSMGDYDVISQSCYAICTENFNHVLSSRLLRIHD